MEKKNRVKGQDRDKNKVLVFFLFLKQDHPAFIGII
jgi:hypothetical protein